MKNKKLDSFPVVMWILVLFSVPVVLQNLYIFTTWEPDKIKNFIFGTMNVFFWIMQRVGIGFAFAGTACLIVSLVNWLRGKLHEFAYGMGMTVFGVLLFLMKLIFVKLGVAVL